MMELDKYRLGCVLMILGLGLSIAAAANAQNIQCGADYTVKRGDFLTKIADDVYGDPGAYQIIYVSNLDAVGADPEVIFPGLVLQIPCIDGSTSETDTKKTSATTATASENTSVDVDSSPFRIVLYDQWAPFLDEKSESGGMLTEIVRRALEESDEKPEHKMHFVSDFNFILNPLLVDHAYDMSVGYTKPKCEAFDKLGEESQFRCNTLDWSQPLYEEVIAYHSLNEVPLLNQHAELFGKRICRPDGYTTADMDTAGVKAESQIKIHEPLNHVSTVHVVIAKSHPKADSMIQVVDNGLNKLKNSGEWFSIVRRHMTEHRKKAQ